MNSQQFVAILADKGHADYEASWQQVRHFAAQIALLLAAELRNTFDHSLAEDIAAEAISILLQKISAIGEPYQLTAWLRQTCRNLLLRHDRHRAVDWDDHAAVDDETPLLAALRSELIGVVRDCVDGLANSSHRHALNAHYRRGTSLVDLARETDRPLGTVKSHLSRGRREVQDCVEAKLGVSE